LSCQFSFLKHQFNLLHCANSIKIVLMLNNIQTSFKNTFNFVCLSYFVLSRIRHNLTLFGRNFINLILCLRLLILTWWRGIKATELSVFLIFTIYVTFVESHHALKFSFVWRGFRLYIAHYLRLNVIKDLMVNCVHFFIM